MNQIAVAVVVIVAGVSLPLLAFWLGDRGLQAVPGRMRERLTPYFFIGPAVLFVTIGLVIPAVLTIVRSFFGRGGPMAFQDFRGLATYGELLTDSAIHHVLINNAIWILVVPILAVAIGLAVAQLADEFSERWERVAKSVIFMPMAISFVGAATIWKFVYAFRPAGEEQIGLLNALVTSIGFEPQAWLTISDFRLNTLLLNVAMVWLQAGFAMVLLSAAIKNVPDTVIEAARVDGATRWQTFWHVVIPSIRLELVAVFTTIVITLMRVFDIVFTMTGGNFNTDVIVNRFYQELFQFRAYGRASALTVLLLVAVIPVIISNARSIRDQHA